MRTATQRQQVLYNRNAVSYFHVQQSFEGFQVCGFGDIKAPEQFPNRIFLAYVFDGGLRTEGRVAGEDKD